MIKNVLHFFRVIDTKRHIREKVVTKGMGNLINDFWTYKYNNKKYFGICEVVKGDDYMQARNIKKYETHIEKALEYTMKYDVVSHMGIQTFCTWLKDRPIREDHEQRYYPFFIEFEASKNNEKEYVHVVLQAVVFINYLVNELGVCKEDILPMINNSRSVYVFINPRTYNLKPDKNLDRIYSKMFEHIKSQLGLTYADTSMYAKNKLMKTPNCFYKGGYFVHISHDELIELMLDTSLRGKLTAEKRSLNYNVPGQVSLGLSKIYQSAKEQVENTNKASKLNLDDNGLAAVETINNGTCGCVKYFHEGLMGKGYRNSALVSVGIDMKNKGYTEEQVMDKLTELGHAWNHDENERKIRSKVRTIFRRHYKFSCEYARKAFVDLNIEDMCANCMYNKRPEKASDNILVQADIINQLYANDASTRHYKLYLELLQSNLFNSWFSPKEMGINDRTLREFCNISGLKREKNKEQVYITNTVSTKKRVYKLPEGFIENSMELLGDYLKHYLKLLIKGYRAFDSYILIRLSKEKMMDELGYKDISGVYKMLKRLEEIGLIKVRKNNVSCIYYEPYNVIDINTYKEERESNISKPSVNEAYEIVNGEQICIPGLDNNLMAYSFNKHGTKKSKRGSPG